MGAMRLSCMIMFILAGAAFLSFCMAFTGIPKALAEWVDALGPSRYGLLFATWASSTSSSAPRSTASR